jgi:hypothetical protein
MIAIHPAVIMLTLLRGFNMDIHTFERGKDSEKNNEWTEMNTMQNGDSSDDENPNKNNLLKTFQDT